MAIHLKVSKSQVKNIFFCSSKTPLLRSCYSACCYYYYATASSFIVEWSSIDSNFLSFFFLRSFPFLFFWHLRPNLWVHNRKYVKFYQKVAATFFLPKNFPEDKMEQFLSALVTTIRSQKSNSTTLFSAIGKKEIEPLSRTDTRKTRKKAVFFINSSSQVYFLHDLNLTKTRLWKINLDLFKAKLL